MIIVAGSKVAPAGQEKARNRLNRKPGSTPVHQIAPADKAAIIDRLYDVAVDPGGFEALLDTWEDRIAPLRVGPTSQATPIEDPELAAHFARASIFLDRLGGPQSKGGYRKVLDELPKRAAFVCDGGRGITGFNHAASIAFGLRDGATMADLPFAPDDINLLREVAQQIASGARERLVTLNLHSTLHSGTISVHVGPLESDQTLALVLSSEMVWLDGFETTLRETFGLTSAEIEIVHGIALGHPLREIAEARARSHETVRTQLRTIFSKTETHSQSELLRIIIGLMEVSVLPLRHAPEADADTHVQDAPAQTHPDTPMRDLPVHSLRLPDGRHIDVIEFGAPDGKPVLYMHMLYGLTRWPRGAEVAAQARGLRVIVPVRAGYGRSSPLPNDTDRTLACALDYAAVLDHFGLSHVTVLSLGADLRFALQLALLRKDLVSGILGCAAQLPSRNAAQYERMGKWPRFILANACYVPMAVPFFVKAGFSLARVLGKERFFLKINSDSPIDIDTFSRPEAYEAMLLGSEVALGRTHSAHEAVTQECMSSETDWSGLIGTAKVPVVLLQGDQDPQSPKRNVLDLIGDYPNLTVHFLPKTGQHLFFKEWERALDELAALMA